MRAHKVTGGQLSLSHCTIQKINSLKCKVKYSATSNNMKLVHWPLMGGVMYNVAVVSLRVVTWAWRRVPAAFCL